MLVLQEVVAVAALAGLGAAHAQALATDVDAGGIFLLELQTHQPAPVVFIGRRCQLASHRLQVAVQHQLGRSAPADTGQLVTGVLYRHARATVGAGAKPEHQLVLFGLAQCHHHRGCARVAAGVDRQVDRFEIAAVLQPLLGLLQARLVVVLAWHQPRQPLHHRAVKVGQALDAQPTQPVGRARVQLQLQAHAGLFRIDIGTARPNARQRIAPGCQRLQRPRLVAVPGRLREARSQLQRPAGADRIAQALIAGAEIQHDFAHPRRRPGLDAEADHPQRGAGSGRRGRAGFHPQPHADHRREIAQRRKKLAHVVFCSEHQALEFGVVEIGQVPVAHQLQMAAQIVLHLLWRADLDRESRRLGRTRRGGRLRIREAGDPCWSSLLGVHRSCKQQRCHKKSRR